MGAGRGFAVTAGFWAGTGLAASLGSLAWAQPVGPAERPPSSFDGTQYVDSEGCAFVRAGISGNPMWVPRLSRDRERLCGFEPTYPDGVPVEAATDPFAGVPNPLATPVAGLPPAAPAVAEAPEPEAAPAPRRTSPSPRVVAEAAPPPPPAAAPVEPVRLTLAQACAGLTGLQAHIRDGRTGATVDCGSGTAPAATAAAVAPAALLRLTLAEVCADAAQTGRRYVYRDTGAPVACASAPMAPGLPSARPTALPPAPAAPAAPVAVAAAGACSIGVVGGVSAIGSGGRCGPQTQSPSGASRAVVASAAVARGTMGAEVARSAVSPGTAALPALSPAIPASNPIGLAAVPSAPARGYERVWDDGRVNLARGVARPVAGPVVVGSRVVAPGVATIPVPVEAAPAVVPATGVVTPVLAPANVPAAIEGAPVVARAPAPSAAIYVQVGAFGEPGNARRAVATLAALGLPVGIAAGRVQAVAAGPFASPSEAQAALSRARAAGYGDAFIR